jgi:hypothetical protein
VSGTLARENVGLIIVRLKAWVAVCWDPLPVTRIVKAKTPGAVGVPLIMPPEDSARPSGNAPEARDHVYGVVPPVAVNVCEYAPPTLPEGRDVVVIESGGGSTVRANDFVAVRDALSRTWTVKFAVPAVVGVPLITPALDTVSQVGAPVTDHVYGGVPPVAARLWEYAVPTVPFERGDSVVIASGGGSTVRANGFVVICDALSRTWTVKFTVPAVVGVPLISPAGDSVSQVGAPVTDHRYGGAPPVAAKLWEYAVPTVPFGRGDDVVIESGGMIVRENPFVTGFDTVSAT